MKLPLPKMVNKSIRMTAKKRAVLKMLENIGEDFFEYGVPPYAISFLAEKLETDLSNLSKTMKALECDGLVLREVALSTCWNAIARDHVKRRCVCYWLVATMEQDKARVKTWEAEAANRASAAFERMFVS